MSGIFGIYSERDCIEDLIWGTSYLQHRGQKFCGWAVAHNDNMAYRTHAGKLREKIDDGASNDELVDLVDELFIVGAWGSYTKGMSKLFLADVRGLIVSMYKRPRSNTTGEIVYMGCEPSHWQPIEPPK